MDHEARRIEQLARRAVLGDASAQASLIKKCRTRLRELVREHTERRADADFVASLVQQVQSEYGVYWTDDREFSTWMDGIVQREAVAAVDQEPP